MIDPTYADAEGAAKEYTRQEMETRFSNAVKNAVGYNEERGDTFELTVAPFHRAAAPADGDDGMKAQEGRDYILQLARHGSPLVAVLIFVMFAFVALRRIGKGRPAAPVDLYAAVPSTQGGESGVEGAAGEMGGRPSIAQQNLRRRVKEVIANDPATATRLIQGWLDEEK